MFCFFHATATTEIYTFLHDALPIWSMSAADMPARLSAFSAAYEGPVNMIDGSEPMLAKLRMRARGLRPARLPASSHVRDRKSTRLNSSHSSISYAVFCLKKNTLQPP